MSPTIRNISIYSLPYWTKVHMPCHMGPLVHCRFFSCFHIRSSNVVLFCILFGLHKSSSSQLYLFVVDIRPTLIGRFAVASGRLSLAIFLIGYDRFEQADVDCHWSVFNCSGTFLIGQNRFEQAHVDCHWSVYIRVYCHWSTFWQDFEGRLLV